MGIRNKDSLSLKQKGILFFAATLLLTLLFALAVFHELVNVTIAGRAADAIGDSGSVKGSDSFLGLRNPLFLLVSFVALMLTLVSGLVMYLRHIVVPLDKVGVAAWRMTDGLFDQPVQVESRDEIGGIGELINDLAVNTQEVLLYFWNHSQENIELIERLERKVCHQPGREKMMPRIEDIFTQLKQANNDVKSMILLYDFFDLKIEKEKMLIKFHTEASGQ